MAKARRRPSAASPTAATSSAPKLLDAENFLYAALAIPALSSKSVRT
jgi:hypothetical protein